MDSWKDKILQGTGDCGVSPVMWRGDNIDKDRTADSEMNR